MLTPESGATPTASWAQPLSAIEQANTAVWRYLRRYKVRLSGQDENRNLEAIIAARRDEDAPAAARFQPQLRRTAR